GFGIGGTGYTPIPLLQNRAFVLADASTVGIAIVNQGANPIIFGTSNTEIARFSAGGPLQITPTAATYNQGLNITQTTPTSGMTAGPVNLNLVTASMQAGTTGSGFDSTGNNNRGAVGFRTNFFVGGANYSAQAGVAILGAIAETLGNAS